MVRRKTLIIFILAAAMVLSVPYAVAGEKANVANQSAQGTREGKMPVTEKAIVSIDPPEVYPEAFHRIAPLAGPSAQIIRISTGQGLGHSSVAVGGYNNNIALFSSGATLSGVTWSSSNPNVFTVDGNERFATISAIGEGFGRLGLRADTTDHMTLTDEANISIYTPFTENAAGRVTSAADIYRGADTITTHRGRVTAGQSLSVVGVCGIWYYALFPDSVTFSDDQPSIHSGYLRKSSVIFPVTGISINPKTLALNVGKSTILAPTVKPAWATEKKVTWTSSNPKIATVDASGKVTAKATGTATITVRTSDGGKTDTSTVAVKLPAPAISTIKSGGNLKVTTTWKVVAGAASYTLLYAAGENGEYKVAKTGLKPAAKAKTVTSTHTAPGYKDFYYRVVAVHSNTACNSDPGAGRSFNTLLPPTELKGDSNGSSITITWKKAYGATGYEVYRSVRERGEYKKVKTIKKGKSGKVSLSYTDTKVMTEKKYYYKIRTRRTSNNQSNDSSDSVLLPTLNRLRLSMPVHKGKITSEFGYRVHPVYNYKKLHRGMDISASNGTSILAAASGTVISARWAGGYGKYIVIDHGNGMKTSYAHNAKFTVRINSRVKRGQEIARADSTGVTTGPHCHFEVYKDGQPKNPRDYLVIN